MIASKHAKPKPIPRHHTFQAHFSCTREQRPLTLDLESLPNPNIILLILHHHLLGSHDPPRRTPSPLSLPLSQSQSPSLRHRTHSTTPPPMMPSSSSPNPKTPTTPPLQPQHAPVPTAPTTTTPLEKVLTPPRTRPRHPTTPAARVTSDSRARPPRPPRAARAGIHLPTSSSSSSSGGDPIVVKLRGARGWAGIADQGAEYGDRGGHDGYGALGRREDDELGGGLGEVRVADAGEGGYFYQGGYAGAWGSFR